MALRQWLRAVGLSLAALSGATQAQAGYSAIYAFGDSLSDSGNFYSFTQATFGTGAPGSPYVAGRFTNGLTAVEYMASNMGLTLHDYAYGGATTGYTNNILSGVPGLPSSVQNAAGLRSEVDGYISSLGTSSADPNALYLVWAGANDFLASNFATPVTTTATAVSNLTTVVQQLYNAGARHFLLPGIIDMGLTPRALSYGPSAAAQISLASAYFNSNLQTAFNNLAATLPDEDFTWFDTAATFQSLLAANVGTGLNTTSSCTSAAANPTCANYLFFDTIHPTSIGHQALAQAFAQSVPEPETAWLLLMGLPLLWRGRRKAQQLAD